LKAIGGVVEAGCVAKERVKTVGRVEVAGCVGIERVITVGRVLDAGCEAEERTFTLSCVFVDIASVRCWANRSRRRRKRKPSERECDESKTAPRSRRAD